jgi:hypothetical protein
MTIAYAAEHYSIITVCIECEHAVAVSSTGSVTPDNKVCIRQRLAGGCIKDDAMKQDRPGLLGGSYMQAGKEEDNEKQDDL